ncbi:MAG: hypothetical protein ACRDNI_06400 [Gaiellaceae bacterium]
MVGPASQPARAGSGLASSIPPILRRLLVIFALAALAALVALAAVLLSSDDDGSPPGEPAAATDTVAAEADLEECAALAEDDAARDCYATALAALVGEAAHPSEALEEIALAAYSQQDERLLGDCHGLMHTVGREYARERGVTLADLMAHLPETNEPGCAAGFAHGLVTGVAPEIDVSRPQAAAEICSETETRYQRYSCVHGFGHAFMRIVREELPEALALCSALGAGSAPDCAQGAYHDYWFAVVGADDTQPPSEVIEDPRALCAEQAPEFVRPCWYRAYVDNRPEEPVDDAGDIDRLCDGLAGLQREACVTAASVVGPTDPRDQLALCTGLEGTDAVSCIRGTKVQNLLLSPPEDLVALVRQCDGFPGETRLACYRWLGKVMTVMTNGEFESYGCRQAPDAGSRRACVAGARESDGPLETFS